MSARTVKHMGDYASWQEAEKQSSGYSADNILDKVFRASMDVKEGKAAYERDSIAFAEMDYNWPTLANLLSVAAEHSGNLSVLDFGGALGSTYFGCQRYLQFLNQVEWSIIEQAQFVSKGREHFEENQLKFYSSVAEFTKQRTPNVILLSSVLQYVEDPFSIIEELTATEANTILIDRTPFFKDAPDRITIQKVPPHIYDASYPMRIFNEADFLNQLSQQWNLIATYTCEEGTNLTSDNCEFAFKGFCFKRIND